jgi:ubiquinol-cytochrome c reductase cytochrome c subunit
MATHTDSSVSRAGRLRRRGPVGGLALALLGGSALGAALLGGRAAVHAQAPAQPRAAAPVDDDERAEQRVMARRIMQDNCLICHSEPMIAGQRLSASQWKAEVEKMVGWGSPLPAEQAAALTEYLSEEYSENTPVKTPARMTYEQALATVRPENPGDLSGVDTGPGQALYTMHCATCHGANGQGADLGPNVVGISILLRPAEYQQIVRDGKNRMPAFKTLLNARQSHQILAWLRSQRYATPAPKPSGG